MLPPPTVLLLCTVMLCQPHASGCEENISSPVLREVKFHSVDYRNILHWKTQSHPDGNQKYFVQYKIYGEKHWTTARHCQGITQLYCDLSQQTSDPWERYYARVQAEVSGHQSSWVLSPRFNPHWETSVSPPTMRLNVTERAIVVRLKPPKSPYRRRRGSWISMKKLQKLTYRVYLMHSGSIQEVHKLEGHVTLLVIQHLQPNTTYCLQAEAHLPRLGRTGDRGPWFCITTP
ncbi:interleukin-22 receptor subunit alpha-2 [Paramormyrops kingsleyae]|uniref:interleukin-22 receptor subunit alpha-2 n=1 Tax=Paramormyrops kingsleyae TaxID=1676925 RepID=UPI003B97243D